MGYILRKQWSKSRFRGSAMDLSELIDAFSFRSEKTGSHLIKSKRHNDICPTETDNFPVPRQEVSIRNACKL